MGLPKTEIARRLRGSRIERSTRPSTHIEDCLAMGWSPEQIELVRWMLPPSGISYGMTCVDVYGPRLIATAWLGGSSVTIADVFPAF